MRVLFLAPFNIHIEPIIASLRPLCELHVLWYEKYGDQLNNVILNAADNLEPDLIVYEGQNGGAFPSEEILRTLHRDFPLVMLCHDASDVTWRPLLELYKAMDTFSVVCNIDGNDEWVKREVDFTCLTPTWSGYYE